MPVSRRAFPRWPFWLLIAAWFCANSPQAALHGVLTWFDGARQFSHQHRLAADVAAILGGEKHAAPALEAAAPDVPKAVLPPLPPEAVQKKLSLPLELAEEIRPPVVRAWGRTAPLPSRGDQRRTSPPRRPPRPLA